MRITIADLKGAKVTAHFRTHLVVDNDEAERLDYSSGDELDELERALAKAAGKLPANHTTYEVALADGSTCYVRFSDLVASFGTDVRVMTS